MQIDPTSAFILLATLSAIVFVLIMVKRKMDTQRRMEELSEQDFMATVLKDLNSTSDGAWTTQIPGTADLTPDARFQDLSFNANEKLAIPVPSSPPALTLPASGAPQLSTQESINPYMQNIDRVAGPVITKLRAASLTEGISERLEMHGNPNAAGIMTLRSGRKFLIIPWWESEAYFRRNLKRFDGIMIITQDGGAIVLSTVEDLIASNF